MAIYMKYGSINGTVTTKGFEKWIELSSFQWGAGRAIASPMGTDVDREASAPSIAEVTVTKNMDGASNKLLMDALAGTLDSKVDIVMTTTTKNETNEFVRYTLEKCGLSGYSISSGGDRPSESLSLNFTTVKVKYTAMGSDGSGSPDVVGYDLSQMKTT